MQNKITFIGGTVTRVDNGEKWLAHTLDGKPIGEFKRRKDAIAVVKNVKCYNCIDLDDAFRRILKGAVLSTCEKCLNGGNYECDNACIINMLIDAVNENAYWKAVQQLEG